MWAWGLSNDGWLTIVGVLLPNKLRIITSNVLTDPSEQDGSYWKLPNLCVFSASMCGCGSLKQETPTYPGGPENEANNL